MRPVVHVKVQAVDRSADISVFQCAFGPVSERKNYQVVGADHLVHFRVVRRAGVVLEPAIKDAGSVDTKEHAVPGILRLMINMYERIDP